MKGIHDQVINEAMRCSLKIFLTNSLGSKWIKAGVRLTRIDDLFFSKPIVLQARTSNAGYVLFNPIIDGCYLVEVLSDKILFQEIINIQGDQEITIKLPSVLGLFKKVNKIDIVELSRLYDKLRTDLKGCFKCKVKYNDLADRYLCDYCKKYYCEKHKESKAHKCWANSIKN